MNETKCGGNRNEEFTILYRKKIEENVETYVLFSNSPFKGPSIQGFEIVNYPEIDFLATSTLKNVSKITFLPHINIDDFLPLFELTDGWEESSKEEFNQVLKNIGIPGLYFNFSVKDYELWMQKL